jgi:hypothetical protein
MTQSSVVRNLPSGVVILLQTTFPVTGDTVGVMAGVLLSEM